MIGASEFVSLSITRPHKAQMVLPAAFFAASLFFGCAFL
jgi:hypothetical protein